MSISQKVIDRFNKRTHRGLRAGDRVCVSFNSNWAGTVQKAGEDDSLWVSVIWDEAPKQEWGEPPHEWQMTRWVRKLPK